MVMYTEIPGGISRTVVVSSPTTHIALTGLEPYTNYSILVFASTLKGVGNASDRIIVTTDEDSKLPKAVLFTLLAYINIYLTSLREFFTPGTIAHGSLAAVRREVTLWQK